VDVSHVISHCVMRKTELNTCRRAINEEKKNPSSRPNKYKLYHTSTKQGIA
jgi:hypothetical protein